VRLARATLDRVAQAGAGAKLTRPEVFQIAGELEEDLDAGRPAVPPRDPAAGDTVPVASEA